MEEREFIDIGDSILFEDDRVRIWDYRLAPGETGGYHRHDLDYLLVQISGDRVAAVPEPDSEGEYNEYVEAVVIPGQVFPIKRGGVERARNIGEKEYFEIIIELKS